MWLFHVTFSRKVRDPIDAYNSFMGESFAMEADVATERQRLTPFEPSTQDEVRTIIKKPPSKYCDPERLAIF